MNWYILYYAFENSSVALIAGENRMAYLMTIEPISDLRENRELTITNTFGEELECCPATTSTPYLTIIAKDSTSTIQKIHKFFFDFFGTSIRYNMSGGGNNSYIPPLQPILNSRIYLFKSENAAKVLENFLELNPKQKYFELLTPAASIFEKSEKLAEVQNLNIIGMGSDCGELLRRFRGNQLIVENGAMKNLDVIEFLKTWEEDFEGENRGKYENLKLVNISLQEGPFVQDFLEPEKILREVNWKKFDGFRSLPVLGFWQRFQMEWAKSHQLCTPNYIVRKSDGQVASVKITRNSFIFVLWDMIEKEILEKLSEGKLEVGPAEGEWKPCY